MTKNIFRKLVDRPEAIHDPRNVPVRIPITIFFTTSQCTAPLLWCARKLDIEVKMILARDVARARCIVSSLGMCCREKT